MIHVFVLISSQGLSWHSVMWLFQATLVLKTYRSTSADVISICVYTLLNLREEIRPRSHIAKKNSTDQVPTGTV